METTKLKAKNAKWLRERSGIVKKRNNAIRRDWFRMLRLRYTSEHMMQSIMQKYQCSKRTIY